MKRITFILLSIIGIMGAMYEIRVNLINYLDTEDIIYQNQLIFFFLVLIGIFINAYANLIPKKEKIKKTKSSKLKKSKYKLTKNNKTRQEYIPKNYIDAVWEEINKKY